MIKFSDLKNQKLQGIWIQNSIDSIDIIIDKKIDESLLFDIYEFNKINIKITPNGEAEIFTIYESLNNIENINIEVKGILRNIVLIKDNSNINNINDNTIILDNGFYQKIIFDFSTHNISINNNITTTNSNSAELYCASVVNNEYVKNIVNKLTNNGKDSSCFMDNYGVAFDNGKIIINGIGYITRGSSKSKNVQKATMFVMDEFAKATSEPYLYIDEDDVIASHANSVGQVSEDTIYYLCSRGIDKDIARKMVVIGYFKKFNNLINSKEIKDIIDSYMVEVITHV